jgi:hypothetical protein
MRNRSLYYYDRYDGCDRYGPLWYEDACDVWDDLDPEKEGEIGIEVLQRWLHEYANYIIPN